MAVHSVWKHPQAGADAEHSGLPPDGVGLPGAYQSSAPESALGLSSCLGAIQSVAFDLRVSK